MICKSCPCSLGLSVIAANFIHVGHALNETEGTFSVWAAYWTDKKTEINTLHEGRVYCFQTGYCFCHFIIVPNSAPKSPGEADVLADRLCIC